MNNILFISALAIAMIHWGAVEKKKRRLIYVTKPAVMLALLIWLWHATGLRGQSAWFAAGLFLSLVGDLLLMLPGNRLIAGLSAFLLAHLAYLVGFNPSLPPLNPPSLILASLVIIIAALGYRRIAAGLETSGQARLKSPVLLYIIVVNLMVLSALLTLVRPAWPTWSALLLSGGALLFLLSDTMLALNRFVAPLRHGPLLVMVTYHLGQMLITLGAALYI